MPNQDLDYTEIRSSVEKGVVRQKRLYRMIFFGMHLAFFLIAMCAVWGTVIVNSEIRGALFDNGFSGAIIVLLPTVLWAIMILSHVAAIYIESEAGEKGIRDQLLMTEVGAEILRKGLTAEGMLEKPKKGSAVLETERVRLSDDGELIQGDARLTNRNANSRQ